MKRIYTLLKKIHAYTIYINSEVEKARVETKTGKV